MNYQDIAEKMVKDRPSNFAYYGDIPLFKTHAIVYSQHRDSDSIERSNYRCIFQDLKKRYPLQVEDFRASHWAVGWMEHITVQMLTKKRKVTAAGKAIIDILNDLDSYCIYNEEDHSELEYTEAHEYIESEGFTAEEAHKIWCYMFDAGNDVGDQIRYRDMENAAKALGFLFSDDEFLEACTAQDLIILDLESARPAIKALCKKHEIDSEYYAIFDRININDLIEVIRPFTSVWHGQTLYRKYTPSIGVQLSLM